MYKCPVCGEYEFEYCDDYDSCPICGWINDGIQNENPDYVGGANVVSLNEYRKEWEEERYR